MNALRCFPVSFRPVLQVAGVTPRVVYGVRGPVSVFTYACVITLPALRFVNVTKDVKDA